MVIQDILYQDDIILNINVHKFSLNYIFIHNLPQYYLDTIQMLNKFLNIYVHNLVFYYKSIYKQQLLNKLLLLLIFYIYILYQLILNMLDIHLNDKGIYNYVHIVKAFYKFPYKVVVQFHIFMVDFLHQLHKDM